jgi:RNA polymerase sigma factor (sigma-70 family)
VNEQDWLAARFEERRGRLRAVAYRMLGSLSEADDAVQDAWLRLSRSEAAEIENLDGWLTTAVARVCLNRLETRQSRREEPLGPRIPEPVVSPADRVDPEHEALLADSLGLALLVVLETLAPDERLAFVLHDMFAVPFEEVALIVGRSQPAARQLASRARRRVGDATPPEPDLARQREVVDAFLQATREGNFDALLEVLHPDVVLIADRGGLPNGASRVRRGAAAVVRGGLSYSHLVPFAKPALVNGAAGLVATADGRPVSVAAFTVADGKIVEIDILADPQRLSRIDFSRFGDAPVRDAPQSLGRQASSRSCLA